MAEDFTKRVFVSVWNTYSSESLRGTGSKERNTSPSKRVNPFAQMQLEFMGCMSFGLNSVDGQNKVSAPYISIEILDFVNGLTPEIKGQNNVSAPYISIEILCFVNGRL